MFMIGEFQTVRVGSLFALRSEVDNSFRIRLAI